MRLSYTNIRIVAFLFFTLIAYILCAANFGWDTTIFTFIKQLPYGDKLTHFVLIGGFAFFMNLILKNRTTAVLRWSFLLGSTIVFAFVTLEEFSQIYIPRRTFDLVDLACNYASIFLIGGLAKRVDLVYTSSG
ncbi:MAG: VanZ family protein [Bacteroidota bacterium]